jgi:hypothetical protein
MSAEIMVEDAAVDVAVAMGADMVDMEEVAVVTNITAAATTIIIQMMPGPIPMVEATAM